MGVLVLARLESSQISSPVADEVIVVVVVHISIEKSSEKGAHRIEQSRRDVKMKTGSTRSRREGVEGEQKTSTFWRYHAKARRVRLLLAGVTSDVVILDGGSCCTPRRAAEDRMG
jgi:hypothetical protein